MINNYLLNELVRNIFGNKIYCGKLKSNGFLFGGLHLTFDFEAGFDSVDVEHLQSRERKKRLSNKYKTLIDRFDFTSFSNLNKNPKKKLVKQVQTVINHFNMTSFSNIHIGKTKKSLNK